MKSGWTLLLYLSAALMLGAGCLEQVMLFRLRKERSARGIGNWKDLFTDASRIIKADTHLIKREERWKFHRRIVFAGGAGAIGLIVSLFGLHLLRLKG